MHVEDFNITVGYAARDDLLLVLKQAAVTGVWSRLWLYGRPLLQDQVYRRRLHRTYHVSAKRHVASGLLEIGVRDFAHTCIRVPGVNNKICTPKVVEKFVREKTPDRERAKPKYIRETVKQTLGVKITPQLASRARQALHKETFGALNDSYTKLSKYLAELEHANPGTYTVRGKAPEILPPI
jgi:hypothetical protein